MHRKLLIGLCAVFIISNSIADETKQTAEPKTPVQPVMPVVSDPEDKHAGKNNERSQKTPNTAENPFSTRNPFFRPAFPPPFSPNTMQSPANNETVHEIANYTMTVTAAYPNGDTKKSTADTINYAQC
ncbi:MAG: hypothetical protein LBV68_08515, partial [Spirochaetaceae bacterium]|nr:hypothetical protein [Spirochaetaceae bacterium]